MGVKVKTLTVAANTSTGTQTITLNGFGTVIGYEIWVTNAVTDGTEVPNLITSQGFCDGTGEVCVSTMEEDGVGTTNDRSRISETTVVQMMDTAAALDGVAVHDSFTTDGIVIDWTTAPSAAWNMHIVLYGGTTLQLEVGQSDTNGVGTITVSTSFQLDALRMASVHATPSGGDALGSNVGLGTSYDTGSGIGHGCISSYSRDNQSSTTLFSMAFNNTTNRVGRDLSSVSSVELITINATDFVVETFIAASANFIWMALKSTTNKFFAGTFDSPNSTGNQSITGIGFKPQFCAMAGGLNTTVNTDLSSGSGAGQLSIGFFDGARRSCFHLKTKDNTGTAVKDMRWDNIKGVVLRTNQGQGRIEYDGDFVSLDNDGFTLDLTEASTTTHVWGVFAVERDAPVSPFALRDSILSQGVVPFERI